MTRHKCLLVVRTAKWILILLLIFEMIHWETQVNYRCPSSPYFFCSENRHDKNEEGLKRLSFLRFVNSFGIFGEKPKHCWLLFKQVKGIFLNCLKLELLNIKNRSIPKSCHYEQLVYGTTWNTSIKLIWKVLMWHTQNFATNFQNFSNTFTFQSTVGIWAVAFFIGNCGYMKRGIVQ